MCYIELLIANIIVQGNNNNNKIMSHKSIALTRKQAREFN